MIFKVTFEDQTTRFSIDDVYNKYNDEFLKNFEIKIIEMCNVLSCDQTFPFTYIDEDEDTILVKTRDELAYHIEEVWLANNMKKVYIRI
jgi:hypothetical protein